MPGWRNWQTCLPAGRRAIRKTYVFLYIRTEKRFKELHLRRPDFSVERRVRQHNEGKERTTKPYRPFQLILVEEFASRDKAREREVLLKSGCGKELLRELIHKENTSAE
jgi:putative endonuclease